MLLLLILPTLISGYIVFTKHPYNYYRLHRYDGQLLYLESAKSGFMCTVCSSLVTLFVNNYVPPKVDIFGYDFNLDLYSFFYSIILPIAHEDADELTWVLLIATGAIGLAYFYAFWGAARLRLKAVDLTDLLSIRRIKLSIKRHRFLMRRKDESALSSKEKAKIVLMSSILKDSPMDALFYNSYLIDGFYLMITMDDRKVYIGRVLSLGEPNEAEGMDQEITITPYASGYRDKDTLGVSLTTKYNEVSRDVALTIRQDKIILATHFSEDIYEEFQRNLKRKSSYVLC
ncbi:hypothetical protein [Vibrio pectenicida]|uniref:Uncharacterized protein n=1 Tax=Vibrio pectenicida TaxID=62763 RepID=A0A3R9FPW4_9VIBR|nr:hypothetical protein [Vibrio pectenicida]RSD31515.1 hypothetical protein EJA03_08445 [Vibrio pectenicida]